MGNVFVRHAERNKVLSSDQQAVADAIVDRYPSSATLGGLAGSGKSFLAGRLPKLLGINDAKRVSYLAPTGRAVASLNQRAPGSDGQTIHSFLYHSYERHCEECTASIDLKAICHGYGDCGCGLAFSLMGGERPGLSLIIVDESSMVSERLYDDLVGLDTPIIWIGDHGQLPPVKSSFNLMAYPDFRLEKIHRQAADSPIIQLAHAVRIRGYIPLGEFGPDIWSRSWDDMADDVLFDQDWRNTLMLAWKNETRIECNKSIREHRGFASDHPEPGDRLICLRNDFPRDVVNGSLGTLISIGEDNRAIIQVDDGPLYDHRIYLVQLNNPKTQHQFHGIGLWDYGYTITTHKSQGSQARRVIVIEQPPRWTIDYRKWLYTAITRAEKELWVLS